MSVQKPLSNPIPVAAEKPYAEAIEHHRAGRFAEAEKLYRVTIGLAPQHSDALRLLGAIYLQTKKPEAALPLLQEAQRYQPQNHEILTHIGVALRDTGDAAGAEQYFRSALKIKPDDADALSNLGLVLQDRKDLAGAAEHYERALRVRRPFPTATANLASVASLTGDHARAVALFQEALAFMPGEAKYWTGLGQAQQKLGQLEEAKVSMQRALMLHPDDPAVLVFLGHLAREQRQIDTAIAFYNRALKVDADPIDARLGLAACAWENNDLDTAIAGYEQAVKLKPDCLDAVVNLGVALWSAGRRQEGRVIIERLVQKHPDHMAALINHGITYHDEGYPEKALEFLDRAIALDPNNRLAQFRKSFVLLALGNYAEGWKLYETGLDQHLMRGLSQTKQKPWDGKPLLGKRLLLTGEQGFGDILQFVRYAKLVKPRVGTLKVLCPKALVRLLAATPWIDSVHDQIQTTDFDEHLAMMSLPYICGTVLDTIPAEVPYLFVADDVRVAWIEKFDPAPGLKVGLVWAGSARKEQINSGQVDKRRSVSLAQMAPLLNVQGARFYSLQKDEAAAQIVAGGYQDRIIDIVADAQDFADTAAIIQNLDLVITVDTAIAHLAGGLGKPVWILSRFDACWRWLKNRPDSPWYPTARIFGQPSPGDWDSVMRDVEAALRESAGR